MLRVDRVKPLRVAVEEAKGMMDRVTAELRAVCNRVLVSRGGDFGGPSRLKIYHMHTIVVCREERCTTFVREARML